MIIVLYLWIFEVFFSVFPRAFWSGTRFLWVFRSVYAGPLLYPKYVQDVRPPVDFLRNTMLTCAGPMCWTCRAFHVRKMKRLCVKCPYMKRF